MHPQLYSLATLLGKRASRAAVLASLGLLPACTVYAPMQPTMPLVSSAGDVELSVHALPTGRGEASVAYSPGKGAVFTGAFTTDVPLGQQSSIFLTTRQYEVGGGYYRPLGKAWLLNVLGGFGRATSSRQGGASSMVGAGIPDGFQTTYLKYFGQLGIAHIEPKDTYGFTYRLTQVEFESLTESSVGALPLKRMLRHEGMFFWRSPLGPALTTRWHVQGTMGLSISLADRYAEPKPYTAGGNPALYANQTLLPVLFLSGGVVYAIPGKRKQ